MYNQQLSQIPSYGVTMSRLAVCTEDFKLSYKIIQELRSEVNLKPLPSNARTHVSIAGIASAEGGSIKELQKLRKEWCHKNVSNGIPSPHSILKKNSS